MQSNILNTTNYDKEFYRKIAGQKFLKDPIVFFGVIMICLSCYSGSTLLINNGISFISIIYLIMGLLIIPFFCLYLPYSTNCKAYEKVMKLTKGKEFIVDIKFSGQSFNMKNTLGQSELHNYKEIKSIKVSSNLITININKGNPIYLDQNSFVNSSFDDFKEYIEFVSNIKINN